MSGQITAVAELRQASLSEYGVTAVSQLPSAKRHEVHLAHQQARFEYKRQRSCQEQLQVYHHGEALEKNSVSMESKSQWMNHFPELEEVDGDIDAVQSVFVFRKDDRMKLIHEVLIQ